MQSTLRIGRANGHELGVSKLNLAPLFHQRRDVTPSHGENWRPPDRQAQRDLGSFPVLTFL